MAETTMGQREAVLDVLVRASDVGEARTRAAIQQEVAIGAGDLDAVLNGLREEGLASEVAPGEWETGLAPEPASEPAGESPAPVEADEDEAGGGPVVESAAEFESLYHPPAAVADELPRVTVLSRAMVESLDPDALGKLVLAGVQGENGAFVLRVEP